MSLADPTGEIDAALPVEEAYDLAAPYYDRWHWQTFWHRSEYPHVREPVERFRRSRSSGLDLLDVGCGTGWYIEELSPLLAAATGIDLSANMLSVARHRLPNAVLLQADARSLPFPSARFDVVLCTRVLSHLSRIEPAIQEMRRLLRPGGLLVVSNVDAGHRYEQTRLPFGANHVFADTFKHDRETILSATEGRGFVADASHLIFKDGSSKPIKRRRLPASDAPPVGWVASWRRSSHPS